MNITEALVVLENWNPNPNDLDALLELSEKSLSEVKHLTEYEDEKANRILTAVAFLSALAGVLYVGLLSQGTTQVLVVKAFCDFIEPIFLFHLTFGLYCLITVIGAVFVIEAVRPKFRIPREWGKNQTKMESTNGENATPTLPPSMLFFEKILEVNPVDWAKAFTTRGEQEIRIQYIKNCIIETYFVAEKIRIKMRYLKPGVYLLKVSVILFAIWILIAAWNAVSKYINICF